MTLSTRPSGRVKPSMFSRRTSRRTAIFASPATSTSQSKWPALVRMALFFITSKCFGVITSLQPVTVTNTSPYLAASSMGMTRKPFMVASRALKGSTSVTITSAPMPLARMATPLPHQPYPATTTVLPATTRLVVCMMASHTLWPVPYLLS